MTREPCRDKADYAAVVERAETAEREVAALREQLATAQREREQHERLMALQHTRTIEADKLWRAAHPERGDVWPDLGELVDWLMLRADIGEVAAEERDGERKRADRLADAAKTYRTAVDRVGRAWDQCENGTDESISEQAGDDEFYAANLALDVAEKALDELIALSHGETTAPPAHPPTDARVECPGCGELHIDGHHDSCACDHCAEPVVEQAARDDEEAG